MGERFQAVDPEERAVKEMACHDDMRGTRVDPGPCVAGADPAADLEPTRIGRHRRVRRFLVPSAELNDMSASQAIVPIERREFRCGPVRLEIRPKSLAIVPEASAHDLFHLAFVEVNAGAEAGHRSAEWTESNGQGKVPAMEKRIGLGAAMVVLLAGCGKEEPAPVEVKVKPEAPRIEGMVWVPGGKYLMGSYSGMPNEQPAHEVDLDGFYLDETEVTNAQFQKFVDATGYVTLAERPMTAAELAQIPAEQRPKEARFGSILFQKTEGAVPLDQPVWWRMEYEANWRQPGGPGSSVEGKDDHPVVCVTYGDAVAYAKWAGKRLPTEAEWEYAARGGLEGRKYEWGNDPLPPEEGSKPSDWRCNIWQGYFPYKDFGTDGHAGTGPVKSYQPNGFGLFDMTGNVWEICSDYFGADYYAASERKNPQGPSATSGAQTGVEVHVMRGASWRIHRSYGPSPAPGAPPILEFRVSTRNEASTDTATNDVGFRCARNP